MVTKNLKTWKNLKLTSCHQQPFDKCYSTRYQKNYCKFFQSSTKLKFAPQSAQKFITSTKTCVYRISLFYAINIYHLFIDINMYVD